jgi:hypothetical protein
MDPMRDSDTAEAEYLRYFDSLAKIADGLHLPPDEAVIDLINDVIVSSLVRRRNIPNIDAWLAAAFTHAVQHRTEGATC